MILDHPTNPKGSRAVARTRSRALFAICAILGCAAWAWWPLSVQDEIATRQPGQPQHALSTTPSLSPNPALDETAFYTPLWIWHTEALAEAPPKPKEPPPPPPPLKLQLIAVLNEPSGRRALVYDPDSDKVLAVAVGDRAGAHKVSNITLVSVDLTDELGIRTLALRDAGNRGAR